MKKYYIAYGSNLNVQQMKFRCPTARVVGISEIKDYELLYKGSKTGSYLTIEKKKGSVVPIAVWEISPDDERRLDAYEGFPNFYYKKDFDLYVNFCYENGNKVSEKITKNPRKLSAFAYIMHESRKLGIPSETYVNTCRFGYAVFGFDFRYLDEAYKKSLNAK